MSITPKQYRRVQRWFHNNPEKRKEYNKRYYAKNAERRRAIARAFRAANPDRQREQNRVFRARHPNYLREYRKRRKLKTAWLSWTRVCAQSRREAV